MRQSLQLPIFVMSASTPLATVERTFQNRLFVPISDMPTKTKSRDTLADVETSFCEFGRRSF